MPFIEQVKRLWPESDLTLAQLAEICNISESSASRYLNGKIMPPVDVAEKIIAVLGGDNHTKEGQDMQSVVQHFREMYETQLAAMQEEQIKSNAEAQHIREIYEAQITSLKTDHTTHVAELQRDKRWMAVFIAVMFVVLVYLFVDGLHGNWGIFQTPIG